MIREASFVKSQLPSALMKYWMFVYVPLKDALWCWDLPAK